MKIILLILMLSFTAFGQKTVKELERQKKPFKNSNRYFVMYDKFEDRTTVRCLGFNLIGLGASFAEALSKSGRYGRGSNLSTFYLGAGFAFPGDTLKDTAEDYFIIFDYSGDEWQFLRNSRLIALVDGERVEFGSGEAVRDVERRGVNEKIGFKVSREELKRLSEAKTVEIKIGGYAAPLKNEYLQMFGNVLKLGDASLKAEKK